MRHPIRETKMVTETKRGGKGHTVGIEILMFLLVFFFAQTVQSVPVTAVAVVSLFSSEQFSALSDRFLQGDPERAIEAVTNALTQSDTLMLVQLFSTVLAIGVAVLYCRLIEGRSISSMGLRRGNILLEYGVGALFGMLLFSAVVGICVSVGGVSFGVQGFSWPIWLLYLLGFLVQGMSEEVMCRGYLMLSISRKSKLWVGVVWNSILFALLHIFNPGIGLLPLLNIALFGAFASIYSLKRGNLWGVCAIHSLWNFVQGNLFGISVSGLSSGASPLYAVLPERQSLFNGGSFGMEGGLCATAVLTMALLCAIFLMPTNKKEVEDFNEIRRN